VANRTACAANLRSILQAVQIYASQNNGAIPGSGHTTARFLFRGNDSSVGLPSPTFNDNNCPGIIQVFDWASPVARIMGLKFNDGPTSANRVERFVQLRDAKPFLCPDNDTLSGPFDVPIFPIGRAVSYNAALSFLLIRNPRAERPSAVAYDGIVHGRIGAWNPPAAYNVRIGKVGNPARKVMLADGARYSGAGVAPDASIAVRSSYGGAFADQGPAMRFSQSWDRSLTPGNDPHPQNPGTFDARLYAFRHGVRTQRARADQYKLNAAFFDGHVESLGDLEAANPEYWFPRGTELTVNASQVHKDVLRRYFNSQPPTGGIWIVP
jgi:prepilin-type processing-associated H-X9-DG protein